MRLYSYTDSQLTEEINKVKDLLAKDLYYAGVISEEQCEQIEQDYAKPQK